MVKRERGMNNETKREQHLQQLSQETLSFVDDFVEVWWSMTHLLNRVKKHFEC